MRSADVLACRCLSVRPSLDCESARTSLLQDKIPPEINELTLRLATLSRHLSFCNVEVPESYKSGSFENYYTDNQLRVFALGSPNVGDLVQGEHPQNSGGIGMGSLFSAGNLQYL